MAFVAGQILTTAELNALDINSLTVDTDTLVVDAANDRVGVNKASPTQALDVAGTATATALAVTGEFTLPTSDGSADQVMVTNGSGTVTWADQSSGGAGVPSGSIVMWSGSSAPTGWLECDGSAVSRTTYSDLFAVIGTRYGAGDGSSTFNLPNPVDRVAMGIALSTTPSANTLSVSSAMNSLSLGNQSADHSHNVAIGNQSANHSHTITSNAGNQSGNHVHGGSTGSNNANHSHNISSNSGNNSANHRHNLGNNNANHSHGYIKPNSGSTGNSSTGSQSHNHTHNVSNQSANHSHTITSNAGNQSANHAHNFTTNNNTGNHSHTITSNAGDNSGNHSHTGNAGNNSASHNHALSSSSIASTVNIEPFGFIIKT